MSFLKYVSPELQQQLIALAEFGRESKRQHNRQLREKRKQRKLDAAQLMYELRNEKFEIELFWGYKTPQRSQIHDIFDIEGVENAMKLFEEYRGIGHRIRLSRMILLKDGKKLKALNFKY
jgi:hypothetical protein